MANPVNITLTDANAVTYTFIPLQSSMAKTVLETKTANIPAGEKSLLLSFNPRSAQRKSDRTVVKFNHPIELGDVTNGFSVSDVARFNGTIYVPETMSTAERTVFATLCGEAMVHAVIQAYVADRDPIN